MSLKSVYLIALVRHFGPELYGLYAHGQAWYLAFLPATMLGIGPILAREIGRNASLNLGVVDQSLTLKLTGAVATTLLCAALGWVLATDPLARSLTIVFAVALLGRSMSSWNEQVFAAFEASRHTFRLERLFRPLEVLTGLLLLSLGAGVLTIAALHAALWSLQALRGFLIVRRELNPARPRGSAKAVLRLFVLGLPIAVAMFLNGWMVQGPLVLYGYLTDANNRLGQIALALQAFFLLLTIPTAIASAATPVLARSISRGPGKDRLYLSVISRAGAAAGTLAGILGVACGPMIFDVLFGDRYSESAYLLGPALWLLVPFVIGNAASTVLAAQGRFGTATIGAFAGAATMSLTIGPLSTALGPTGAIVATGCGMLLWAIIGARLVIGEGSRDDARFAWAPLGGTSMCIAVTYFLVPFGAAAATIGGIATLFLTYTLTRAISIRDISNLKTVLNRLRG